MYRFSSLYLLILIVAPGLIAQETDGRDAEQNVPIVHYVSHRSAKVPWKNPPGTAEEGDWVFFRTDDDGQSWIPVAAIYPNADGMASLPRFEKDGHYGYRFVKLKGGMLEATLTPLPGTPPEIKIILDTKAPICRWTLPQRSLLRGPPVLLEWEAKDDNLSENCVRIDYRREGTYEWKRVADRISNSGSYRWKNPPRGLGQVRFRLTIIDRGGLVATIRSRTYEVTPVRLTIRMGPGARTHHKPGPIPIPYILDNYAGMSIAGASLWVTHDEGKNWGMADERMETRGIFEMRLLKEGIYGLWMEAREPGAPKSPGPSSGQLPMASIVVDGTPPTVVFQCAPGPETRFKPGQTLTLTWSAKDKHLRSNEMRIEASKDGGKTWEVVHQNLASRGTNQISIPDVDDESFLLRASITDQAGNRTDQFLPDNGYFRVGSSPSVTPPPPTPEVPQPDIPTPLEQPKGFTAHLFNFNGSSQQPEIYKGGKTEVVRWYLPSKTTQAKLEVNYGDGTYQTLKEGIRSNQYVWILPRITQSNCRLRLTIEDEEHPAEMTSSRKTFSIDSLPPRCTKILGMKWLGSRSAQLNMTAFIEDQGDAGVKELRLWSRRDSPDSSTEWRLEKHSKVDRATWAGRWRLFNSKPADGRWHFFVTSTDRVGNESPPPKANSKPQYTVTIDSKGPEVEFDWTPIAEGYHFRWTAQDPNPGRVAIEYSEVGTDQWHPIHSQLPMQGEHTWTVKAGRFEQVELLFRVRAADAAGNETKMERITPGVAPVGTVRNELAVVATGPRQSDSHLIQVTYDVRWIEARAQLQRVDVWLSPDGGASWKGAYGPDDPEAPIPSTIQVRVNRDGTYGIIARARDSLGNQEPPIKANATPEFSVLVDTAPPRLEVNSTPSLETPLAPNTPILLSWEVQDANLSPKPVHIEISEDGGRTWKDLDRNAPPRGNRKWDSSSQERTYIKFRLTATDLAGKTAQKIIPAQAPSVEVTRLEQSSDGRLSAGYRVRNLSAPHRLQRVEIFTRMSGNPPRRWTPSGQYKTGIEGTFHLDLPPAAYDLLIRLILERDIQKSPDPKTKPTASYQLGGTGSELELLSLNGGPNQVYQGGSTETVRWRLRSSMSPAALKLSYRVSESGEWIPVTQLDSDTDSYEWPLPRLTARSVRIRLEWEGPNGKKAWATSRNPFAIDSASPQFESIEGPSFYSHDTAQPIRLTIQFRDIGDAGLARGILWERPLGKTRWQRMGAPNQKVDPTGIWVFELRLKPTSAQAHEFFVTGVDRAGNAMTPPTPDSPPHHTMTIDSIKPDLQFSTTPSGENPLREGEVLQLEWLASDENLAEKPVQILYLGKDRNWRPIATNLDAQGSMNWIVPSTLAGSPVRIRASARDQASNVTLVNWGTSASVTQRPPGPRVEMPTAVGLDVRALGPFESAHRTIKLDISTQGLAPGTSLTKVNVFWTKDGGLRWEGPAAISRILSPNQIETQLPTDGRLGLTLRGITSDGTAESTPRSPNPPELDILVDSTPPEVQLTDLDEDVFWNRPIYPIRWQPAADENLSDRPIRLYFRLQGENSWKAIEGDLPNRGSHAWRIPAGFMGPAQFKIVARDRLGNQSEQISPGRFYFESIRPTLRVIAPKGLVNQGGQEIIFELLNRKLELEKVDIYRSIDGGTTWQPALGAYTTRGNLHALGNRKYRLAYEGIEGENSVYLVAHDRAGNHNPLPTPGTLPQLTFLLDQIPPRVMIQDSMGGKAFPPGHSLDLEWSAADLNLSESSIKIALSDSSGRTWETTLSDNLPNSGKHPLSLPQKNGEHYRIRVQATDRAGNTGTAVSGEFIIDGLPPTSQALPPENWTESTAIPIQVTARDAGGAGVQAVQLWFKHEEIEDGKWQLLLPWTPHPLSNPIPLSGPDGDYEIVSRSRDRAGNLESKSGFEEAGPTPEATADASLTLSRTGPQVRFIKTFAQSGLVGGGAHSIHWETNWNQLGQIAPITQVQIKFSTDGGQNWELIAGAEALPDTPPFTWTPPPSVMKETCYLQILVQNEFGQKSSSTSAAFRLDTVPPKTTIRFQDDEDDQVRGWIEPSLRLDLEMLPLLESLPRLPSSLFHALYFSASETMKKATNAFFDGRYPEAIRLIQSQLDSTPTPSFQLHYLLALSLRERDGDSHEVEHHLKIASKLAGNDPKIANDLGCLYFRRGQFDSAHQWFNKAIQTSQGDLFDKTTRARFFYNLGATYYHQKDPSGAIGAFNQCLSHAPIREAHVYLALAHARLGQTAQEIQHLRDIALLYPSDSSVSSWARNRLRVRPASAPKSLAR